jgi:hypothetical protein
MNRPQDGGKPIKIGLRNYTTCEQHSNYSTAAYGVTEVPDVLRHKNGPSRRSDNRQCSDKPIYRPFRSEPMCPEPGIIDPNESRFAAGMTEASPLGVVLDEGRVIVITVRACDRERRRPWLYCTEPSKYT